MVSKRPFTVLPAVDVIAGRAVRLIQGRAASETDYGDPIDAALQWQREGADWLHLVDLDAAFGHGSNIDVLADIVGRLDIEVEISGGIRDDSSLTAALSTGCARVNLGTAALEDPQWCSRAIAENGDRIAVALDVKPDNGGYRLRSRGWLKDGGEVWEVVNRLERDGCSRFVVTDVTRDGTLDGPNLSLLTELAAGTSTPIIASGGVSSLKDLEAIAQLTELGIEGAIVGKALYAGRFTLPQALSLPCTG